MGEPQVYLNGSLVPAAEARISVFDTGLLHGASAFTTMRAHNGRVFRLDRHLARLMETVELLDIRAGADEKALAAAVGRVVRANELVEARVRITLTPGGLGGCEPAVLITAEPVPQYPDEWYTKGISVIVTAFKQARGDPTYGYKTGCYLPRVLARQEAARKHAAEALWYTTDNLLAEACFCNVFLVLAGKACTPPRDTPVLPGVVRQAVLELCGEMDIPADSGTPLTVREMLAAEEMFLTSSVAGIRPVARVERHPVGDEKPGPITRKIMDAYARLLDRECSK
ncbi:MAG TPA: aminotransferase class IV [Phycisphaerae bacterium]|nr:aminotransferase class IV [Phycisphaerae bacterium]